MKHIIITIIDNNNPEKEIEIKTQTPAKRLETVFLHVFRTCLIYCDNKHRLKSINFYEEEILQ